MAQPKSKIRTVIIDDDENYLLSLKNNLSFYPEIEIIGCASRYRQAHKILISEPFDLLFLDVEMPGKNGFELMEECRKAGKEGFHVIFYTAFDKYAIKAIRESAFDYILKPLNPEELKNALDRFINKKKTNEKPIPFQRVSPGEIIALPAVTGIRFTDKSNILLFQWNGGNYFEKKSWTAVLADRSEVKLKTGTSAKDIIDIMNSLMFIRINPSLILNITYLAAIEYATRQCVLLPPFNDLKFTVSRSNLVEIREKFDLL